MPPLFPLTLALYAVSCTLYFLATAQPQQRLALRLALPVLLLAFSTQALDIGWLCLHGQHPGSSAREATFFIAWLMAGAFPLLTCRQPIPLLGALLLPVAMMMGLLARLVPATAAQPAGLFQAGHRALAVTHIFASTLGTALFGVAAAASVVYLLREKRLKGKLPMGKLPIGTDGSQPRVSLETLDTWNRQSISFGFLCFTTALVTGTVWLMVVPQPDAPPAGSGLWETTLFLVRRPQYSLSVVTWLLYAGLLYGRVTVGLRGKRAAAVTLYGFALALGVLLVYLLRDAPVKVLSS